MQCTEQMHSMRSMHASSLSAGADDLLFCTKAHRCVDIALIVILIVTPQMIGFNYPWAPTQRTCNPLLEVCRIICARGRVNFSTCNLHCARRQKCASVSSTCILQAFLKAPMLHAHQRASQTAQCTCISIACRVPLRNQDVPVVAGSQLHSGAALCSSSN